MNQAILDRVLQSPRLPSLPTIALQVIDLVAQKDVNIKQIAGTISHDPALSSKILKTVNSSFYGQAHSISTVSHALVVLGLNSVKTLALGFSLVPNLRDAGGEGFDHVVFWKRSLYSAVAARSLAQQVGLPLQEEAFLGGLLQDLGMLAMNQALGEQYTAIVKAAGEDHRALVGLEREKLGCDHAKIGGALAEHWKLPPVLSTPVAFHEDAAGAPAELLPLVRCVVLGGRLADVFVTEQPHAALQAFHALAQEWFALPPQQAEALLDRIHSHTLEVRKLLELPLGDLEAPSAILARANEALLQLSLQQERQASELQKQNRELAEKATRDALTGAANRGCFNDFLAAEFAQAAASGQPLSLIFLDADHFKKFNDTYGHPTGDRVLKGVAAVLRRCTPERALVARYGGEEFAVVLPGMSRVEATALAERIRNGIAGHTITSDDGKPLSVTASIGVATFEGGVFARPDQLVKAADQGVYAAKAATRNCVRVFTPKPRPQAQVA